MEFAPARPLPYVLSPSRTPWQRTARSVEPPTWTKLDAPYKMELEAAIHASVEEYRRILGRLQVSPPGNPGALLEREERLHSEVGRGCLDPVVAVFVQAAHARSDVRERARQYVRSIPGLVAQEKAKEVHVTLLGGSRLALLSPYYLRRPDKSKKRPGRKRRRGKRGKAGNGCYPMLMVLGIYQRVTPALASEVARLAVLGTYQEASASLRVRGISLDAKQISQLAGNLAQRSLDYRSWCMAQTTTGYRGSGLLRGKRLVIGVDGGRVRVRESTGGRLKSGRRGFKACWREPKVFIIYEVDAHGKKLRRGFLRQDATLQDANGLFALLGSALRQIGAHEALSWVFVGDGAEWIWNRVPELVTAVGYSLSKVTQVVDFYHAVEHLSAIAEHVKGAKQRREWLREAKRLLKWGLVRHLITRIKNLARGRKAKLIAKGASYFEDHSERMAYRRYEKSGIPLGSGAVESCIRRVVNLRFKGNSVYWRPETGEGLLHCRAQLLAGRWKELAATTFQPECFWSLAGLAA